MDTGRPGPPDPGGQAYQQLGECSSPNGTFVKGVTQRQNKPGPAAGGSSGSPRQPQIGKHKASSAARSQQPESASACEAQSLDAILGSAPPGTAKETRPQLRQGKREKIAAASATSTGDTLDENIRTGSESKRDLPLPIKPTRSMVWIDSGLTRETFFGSLIRIPGVTVLVTMLLTRMGDPVILLSMGVNKNDLSKPISKVEAEVSRFELVLTPRILTRNKPRKQHNFKYACMQHNEGSLGEARAEIMNLTKGNLEHLICIDTGMASYHVLSPYERQYWSRLRDSELLAHRAIEAGTDCLNSLEQTEVPKIRFKFWFRDPCVLSELDRFCANPSKQCVEERRSGSAASEERQVPEPTLGESQSPSETVSDDRLAVTTESRQAPSPGRSYTSALSMVKELEGQIGELEGEDTRKRHQIIELENEDMEKHRRIRALAREVDVLKAEGLASATQQQRQAEVLEQMGERILELQARLLEKDSEIGFLKDLNQHLSDRELERIQQFKEFFQRYRESLHLPGISAEDKASESDQAFPAIPGSKVEEASESSHGWPAAIPKPTAGESAQGSAPPSDQRIEMEPLDGAEGFPDEGDPPNDEASDTAYDDDAAIDINAFAEPPSSSSPKTAVEGHEEFNTDWAAECHNLKKMKRSAKSKRRQQKKLTEKD